MCQYAQFSFSVICILISAFISPKSLHNNKRIQHFDFAYAMHEEVRISRFLCSYLLILPRLGIYHHHGRFPNLRTFPIRRENICKNHSPLLHNFFHRRMSDNLLVLFQSKCLSPYIQCSEQRGDSSFHSLS